MIIIFCNNWKKGEWRGKWNMMANEESTKRLMAKSKYTFSMWS